MNALPLTILSTTALVAAMGLTSCGSSGTPGKLSTFSVRDLMPAKVDVVEVREKDLKDLPLGHERALAFDNQQKKRSFWFFGGSAVFKEPALPEPGSELDGSLLPPKVN